MGVEWHSTVLRCQRCNNPTALRTLLLQRSCRSVQSTTSPHSFLSFRSFRKPLSLAANRNFCFQQTCSITCPRSVLYGQCPLICTRRTQRNAPKMIYDIALRDCLIKRRETTGVRAIGVASHPLASQDSPLQDTRDLRDVMDLFANVPAPARGAWGAIGHSGAHQ